MITQSKFQSQLLEMNRNEAVEQIIKYSQINNNLLDKYSLDFFVNYFDHQMIQDLVKQITLDLQMKKQQFVKLLTSFIKHQPDQTLFLVISLINVYNKIKQEIKSQNGIKISDFTSHICQRISNKETQKIINLKQIVGEKFKPNLFKLRTIDLQPAVIISEIQKQIPQVSKNKKKKDKKVDLEKQLSQFVISPSLNSIMTLGSLSSTINIFNMKFEKKSELMPTCFKAIDKKLAILSFAYSQKQQRIGAILNHIGIGFWDFNDNFRTEKLIQKTNSKKIYYLDLADEWVTTDNDSIYFWDLKEQTIKAKISQKSKSVNDICEIKHIRSTAVSYTFLDESKWVIIYQFQQSNNHRKSNKLFERKLQYDLKFQFKRLARINLTPTGCHSLYYNKFTQLIIPLGYSNNIPLYNIDNKSLDVSFLSQLKGHQTIVTCITQIDQSDIIITGDDHGCVIIWSLSDMRCQQVIRIANEIRSLKCMGTILFYGDTRINMIQIQGLKIKPQNKNNQNIAKNQTFYGIFKYYHEEKNQIYIFTKKSCRILSMLNGKILKIIQICAQDQQILAAMSNLTGFVIGTSKGDIIHFSFDFQLKWKLNSAHSADTTSLKFDKVNKFFLSTGRDNNIFIWSQKTLLDEGPRKSLINGQQNCKEQITLTQLSQNFGIFITCSFSNQIRIWDYQSCKLTHIVEIQQNTHPVCIAIGSKIPLMGIASSNETILFYKFYRKEIMFSFQLIANISRNIFQNMNGSNVPLIKKQSFVDDYQNDFGQDCLEGWAEQIIFDFQNQANVIVAYGKGKIGLIDLKSIYSKYFNFSNWSTFTKSANIQRPIKENFTKQIEKSQVGITKFQKIKLDSTLLQKKSMKWDKKVHKDSITHLNVYQGKYISTLCADGYYKLIEIINGDCVCSLNINLPLPIKWNYSQNKGQSLCNKIHEALIVLDEIFSTSQNLTKKQFQSLNVSLFLDQICKSKKPYDCIRHVSQIQVNDENYSSFKSNTVKSSSLFNDINKKNIFSKEKVEILSDQFNVSDIKHIAPPSPSLKSYEVYKRIKKFIKINKENSNNDSLIKAEIDRKKNLIEDRQSVIQLLSPNYLPKLLNKDINQSRYITENKSTIHEKLLLTTDDFKKIMSETNKNFKQIKSFSSQAQKVSQNKIHLKKIQKLITSRNDHSVKKIQETKKFNLQPISKQFNQTENEKNFMKFNRNNMIKEICDKVNSYKNVLNVMKF